MLKANENTLHMLLQWDDSVDPSASSPNTQRIIVFQNGIDSKPMRIKRIKLDTITHSPVIWQDDATDSIINYPIVQNFMLAKQFLPPGGTYEPVIGMNFLATPGVGPSATPMIFSNSDPPSETNILFGGQLVTPGGSSTATPFYGMYPNVAGSSPGATATNPLPWTFPPGFTTDPRYDVFQSGMVFTNEDNKKPTRDCFEWEGDLQFNNGDGLSLTFISWWLKGFETFFPPIQDVYTQAMMKITYTR